MRLLRNIILMVVPILLMINVYRFVAYNNMYSFRGVSYLYQYIGTFNGFNTTLNVLNTIENIKVSLETISIVDLETFFLAVANFFSMVGLMFALPMMVVVDVVIDLMWVIRMFAQV